MPALVVGQQDVGVLLVEDRGEARGRRVRVGGPERARRVVRRCPGHPRVVVAEELHAADAEDPCRVLRLAGALGGQLGSGGEQ